MRNTLQHARHAVPVRRPMSRPLDYSNIRDRHVGARRLNKLANFLETVDGEKNWAYKDWCRVRNGAGVSVEDIAAAGRPICGTQACAMGWATAIPAFRDKTKGPGLRLVMGRFFSYISDRWTTKDTVETDPDSGRRINASLAAAMRTFALNSKEAVYIFGGKVTHLHEGEECKRLVIAAIRAQAQEMAAE